MNTEKREAESFLAASSQVAFGSDISSTRVRYLEDIELCKKLRLTRKPNHYPIRLLFVDIIKLI